MFVRTTLGLNTFVILPNCLLKRMQKQRSKHRSIISMLNKIFDKHFTVFNVFADKAANLIRLFHCLELELYIYTFYCCISCSCYLFLSLSVCFLICFFVFFVCLFVCLFVCVVVMLLFCFMYLCFYVFALI